MNKIDKAASLNAAAMQIEKMVEKFKTESLKAESDMEKYAGLSDDELLKLTKTDLVAEENYIQRCLVNGDPQKAEPYILHALTSNSRFATEMMEMLITNNILTADRETIFLTFGLMEQFYEKKYIKLFHKVAPADCVQTDRLIFNQALTLCFYEALALGAKYDSVRFNVEQAVKQIPVHEHKRAYLISLALESGGNENYYEKFCFYTFFDRSKKPNEESASKQIGALIDEFLPNLVDELKLKSSSVNICGMENTEYYGVDKESGSTDKHSAEKAFYASQGSINESDVNINISVETDRALSKSVCTSCGATVPIGADNCPFCGEGMSDKSRTVSSSGNSGFNIQIAENESDNGLIHLQCSQCGGSVGLQSGDGAAVCPFCGASYLISGKAAKQAAAGINYDRMTALKPKSESVPENRFVLKSLYNGKLGMVMPDDFTVMGNEMKAIKYPRGNAPELVMTNERGTVNYVFAPLHGMKAEKTQLSEVGNQFMQSIGKMMPSAQFGDSGMVDANNGVNAFFFELVTAAEQDIYNFFVYFFIGGTLMQSSMNCLAKDKWYWGEIFRLAAQTMQAV